LGIGESTATAWVGRWRRTGSVEAKSQKGRSRSPLNAHTEWLLALVGERADLTLKEIRELLDERGVRVGVSSIWRFFDRHGISFKKNRARRRATARRCGRGPAGVAKPPAAA
jgi:transposase